MTNVETIQFTNTEEFDLVEFIALSREGSDPNAMSNGNTPLIKAACTNQSALFDFVLSCGAGPNTPNMSGDSPLIICSQYGNEKNVHVLLYFGGEPNFRDDSGRTPIMHAIMNKHLKVIQILLNNGADLEIQDDFGMSALLYTIKYLSLDDIKGLFNKDQIESLKQQIKDYPETVGKILQTKKEQEITENDKNKEANEDSLETKNKTVAVSNHEESKRIKKSGTSENNEEIMEIKSLQAEQETSRIIGGKSLSEQDEATKEVISSSQYEENQNSWRTKSSGYQEKENGDMKVTNLNKSKSEENQITKVQSMSSQEIDELAKRPRNQDQSKKNTELTSPEELNTDREDDLPITPDEFNVMKDELENDMIKLGNFVEKVIDPNSIPEDNLTSNQIKKVVSENKSESDKKLVAGVIHKTEDNKGHSEKVISDSETEKSKSITDVENTKETQNNESYKKSLSSLDDQSISSGKIITEKKEVSEVSDTSSSEKESIKAIDEPSSSTQTESHNDEDQEDDKSTIKASKDLGSSNQTTYLEDSSTSKGQNQEHVFTAEKSEDTEVERKRIKEVTQNIKDNSAITVKGSTSGENSKDVNEDKQTIRGGDLNIDANEKRIIKESNVPDDEPSQVVKGDNFPTGDDVINKVTEKKKKNIDAEEADKVDLDDSQLIPKDKVNEKNKKGQTHLMIAAGKGDMERIDLLLKSGAETSLKDFHGYNALMYATQGGHDQAVKVIADKTSELDVKTGKGYTALSLAVLKDKPRCITALVSAGAKLDIPVQGEDLFTIAISKDALDSIKVLIALGLNPFEKNKKGRSAFELAKKMKKKRIVAYLKKQISKLVKKDDKG